MTEINEEMELQKILGQFRLALGGLLQPLRLYGQGDYIDSVLPEAEELAWVLHWKLEGLDVPYEFTIPHW